MTGTAGGMLTGLDWLDARLLGETRKPQAGGDVLLLHHPHGFHIDIGLGDGPLEEQPCASHGEALTIGVVATVAQVQLAAGVEVVADVHLADDFGGQVVQGQPSPQLTIADVYTVTEYSDPVRPDHMTSILRKLAVNDRTQAALYAVRRGWIRLRDQE